MDDHFIVSGLFHDTVRKSSHTELNMMIIVNTELERV
jgi:hypothetical protein